MKLQILTHRGLEPSKKDYFLESSYESFNDQMDRGFGLEFDVNFTKDDKIVIFHDAGLERITNRQNKKLISEMNLLEIKNIRLNGNKFCDLDELLEIIRNNKIEVNALHLKGRFQEKKYLNILLNQLKQNEGVLQKIIIFDVKTSVAKYIKLNLPQIILAPSVAHPYDIKRYNIAVKGTLISMEETIQNRRLFEWVWLDEWDLTDENNLTKTLYNENNFNVLRKYGFKIALVAPELHTASPNLLVGESHQGAKNMKTLKARINEIIKLKPDAICTDYPDMIKKLITQNKDCNI